MGAPAGVSQSFPVSEPPDESPLLFCPFCRECFEGETACPDHELALVSFDALPVAKRAVPKDEAQLPMHDARFGRGWLALAVVLILVGFALPMVTTVEDSPRTASGVDVAFRVAPNLVAVPLVAVAFLSVLYRRRSLRSMRGARVAVPVLGLLGMTSLGITLHRILLGAEMQREHWGIDIAVMPNVGVFVMGAGLLLSLFAGLRLGVAPRSRELPHGAGPSGGTNVVHDDDDDDDDDDD
jgi:hypothetical protein